jgi:hypothetical protein
MTCIWNVEMTSLSVSTPPFNDLRPVLALYSSLGSCWRRQTYDSRAQPFPLFFAFLHSRLRLVGDLFFGIHDSNKSVIRSRDRAPYEDEVECEVDAMNQKVESRAR